MGSKIVINDYYQVNEKYNNTFTAETQIQKTFKTLRSFSFHNKNTDFSQKILKYQHLNNNG